MASLATQPSSGCSITINQHPHRVHHLASTVLGYWTELSRLSRLRDAETRRSRSQMWRWVLVTQSQRKLRIILTAWVWVSHLSADLSEELSCCALSLCSLLCALCSNKMHFAKDQLLVCIFGSTHVCVLWQCSAVSAGVGDSITGRVKSQMCVRPKFCYWTFVFCTLLLLNICILYSSFTSIELLLCVRPKWAANICILPPHALSCSCVYDQNGLPTTSSKLS